MPRSTQVSSPLPLPFGFTLLPSRLPGGQLTPLLNTSVNGLPVYLTICPSHAPHVSLLPILLALRVPITPLGLLINYGLSANEFSLDVDGVAPWPDLWVPLDRARSMIRDIGAARLFWDAGGRGMLGKVADAVSWQEVDGWYHNWLPSKTHLPESSYSLDTLLSSSWSFIEVIPDDRCVFTTAGKQRTARLVSEGSSADHSKLRGGPWAAVWDHLLGWTIQAWSQYRMHPSHLSSPRKRRRVYPIVQVANTLPTLFGEPSSKATISLASSDFLLLLPASTSASSILFLAKRLVVALYRQIERLVPLVRHVTPASWRVKVDEEETQWLARLNLALCALVSDVILSIWRLRRENDRLRAALATKGDRLPADIAISASPPPKAKTPSRQCTSESSSEELDVLIQLERRRGGSPPPVSSTPSQSKRKGKGRAGPKSHSQSTLSKQRIERERERQSSSSSSGSGINEKPISRRSPRLLVISSPAKMSSTLKHATMPRRKTRISSSSETETAGRAALKSDHRRSDHPVPGRPAEAMNTGTAHRASPDRPDHDDRHDDPDTKPSSPSASDGHIEEPGLHSESEGEGEGEEDADADSSWLSTTTDSSSLSNASPDFLSFPTMLFSISALLAAIVVLFLSGPRY